MGRWRPPVRPSSPYITAEGHRRLQDELKTLWVERREVVAAVTAAAAEGDRSENAEYIYRKKQLRGIDGRIRYLQKRLDVVEVVRQRPADPERVFFGARVRLAEASGQEVQYRIVGADETDAQQGWISIDSPVARALLGRRLDEEVDVPTPSGPRRLLIVDIAYA
ncbi:transcription elongation factor GreB [Wenzhouxiangella marina]|uniref:Transcription elongation factor GreB n=1 Tax=Wenzhouxiangella marina TaxID=1579979 RepID=A0A0K0XVS2_9GAMM|nr:transcription elongation factor GreB [Wenzhouxiangella marina]AKS41804.1 Transcription elongation factor GreB [Wenzhouxiangella marina]MBB6086434.1 transcription elongation factor GreB [Wenzhouxiangella marina]